MNCNQVRHTLLGQERPDHPGPDEARHLANCPACHTWLRRLVRLERQLALVPVPECAPPVAFLERIAGDTTTPLVTPPLRPANDQRRIREAGRQKLALACALAATLAMFTFAWWAWPPRPPETPGPARDAYVAKRDAALMPTRTPEERVTAIGRLAEACFAEARAVPQDPARVEQLADQFARAAHEDLFQYANEVAGGDRARLLTEAADRLREVESQARQLEAAWATRFGDSSRSMKRIVTAALQAQQRLRALARA